jgi:hypothetical protein
MSNQESPAETPEFTRKSGAESICMRCLLTVRADRYTSLEDAENAHSEACLLDFEAVSYALLF